MATGFPGSMTMTDRVARPPRPARPAVAVEFLSLGIRRDFAVVLVWLERAGA